MNSRFLLLLASLVAFESGPPLLAHHSFAGEFDTSTPLKLEGVVTRIDWENPHVHYFIDVAAPDGTIVNWACETGGPSRLARKGWTHDSLKVGDKVVVHGFPAKDGSHSADGREVMLADGRKIGVDSIH
jgi:hypothetical protein